MSKEKKKKISEKEEEEFKEGFIEADKFKPMKYMEEFWTIFSHPSTKPEIVETCRILAEKLKEAGLPEAETPNAKTLERKYYKWEEKRRANPEWGKLYDEWVRKKWQMEMERIEPFMDKVCIAKAMKDYRYYEHWETKYQAYKKRMDLTSDNEKIKPIEVIAQNLLEEFEEDDNEKAKEKKQNKEPSK